MKKHQIRRRYGRLRAKLDQIFVPRAIRQVQNAGHNAADQYIPKPYHGSVTLFRATEQPYGIYPEPALA